MTPQRKAMIWGAAAGVVPVVTRILAVKDAHAFVASVTLESSLVLLCQMAVLMVLGAIVVRINDEVDAKRAFQLGIVAPALLVGYQTGVDYRDQRLIADQLPQAQINSPATHPSDIDSSAGSPPKLRNEPKGTSLINSLIIAANASPSADESQTPLGVLNNPGILTKFAYAVIGGGSDGWFVITGSYKDKAQADKRAAELKALGWRVDVGSPPVLWGGFYPVLIGAYVTYDEAVAIRDLAINKGLRPDTYIWRR